MVFQPSFRAERAVYLVRKDEEEDVVVWAKELKPPLWNAMSVVLQRESGDGSISHSSESRRDALSKITVQVIAESAMLDAATAGLLEGVWSMALMQTNHPIEAPDGFDGTMHHVASWAFGFGYRTGRTWSPPIGSKPWDLVELAEALETFARSEEPERSAAHRHIVRLAEALRERLRS